MCRAAWAVVGCSGSDTSGQSQDVRLEPATRSIIGAFEQYPLVALSEMHGNAESRALFTSSWQVQLVLLPKPVSVSQGDLITVSIERQRPPRVSCVVTRNR
jgi:hypothetical protein